MNAIEAIRTALKSTAHLVTWFLEDLQDADLLVRPVAGANHIAWQMGHLISSERQMIAQQLPNATFPELPAEFLAQHGKQTQFTDPPVGFSSKVAYVDLFTKVRQATLASLDSLSDSDLDRATTGPMAPFAPSLGAFLMLVSNHSLMHAGQFSVVRRKLGKPVLF
jgi:hypothetical protein